MSTIRLLPATLLVLAAACGGRSEGLQEAKEIRAEPVEPASPPAESGEFRITGPFTHENLAVFLVHREGADSSEFITLHEGLKNGAIEVSEKKQERVSQLLVENKSEHPLFIQEGDRLQGGKQDRIVGISLVIPPKSGKVAVPAFCIERSRWSRGSLGGQFAATLNSQSASNSLRYAAKVQQSQGFVWRGVARQKRVLRSLSGAPNTNSSLNEAIDSKQVEKLTEAYMKALAKTAGAAPDAVGAAFAVNGEILEVTIYPSPSLLQKLYGRLLESYAVQAASDRKPKAAAAPAPSDVTAFMTDGAKKKRGETRDLDGDNWFRMAEFEKKAYCESRYKGKIVCAQWLANPELTAASGQEVLEPALQQLTPLQQEPSEEQQPRRR